MSDTPELGFSVDTSELDKATKALDDVAEAAGRAEEAAGKAGKSGRKMASDFVPGTDDMSVASQRAADAAQRYLDRLTLQLNLLGKNQEGVARLRAEFNGYSQEVQDQSAAIGKKIDAWKAEEQAAKAAAKAEEQAAKAGGKAKEGAEGLSFATAGATREFIVLGHEALTGNFSRMPGSFMVLMERAGGLHTLIGSLISPMGLLGIAGAAAMGGIAYEAIKTTEEIKKLNAAISATNGYSGMTEDRFHSIAQSIAGMGLASTSTAKELETGLIMTGKYSAETIDKMTLAITQYAAVTGEDAEKAKSQLERMFSDPAKAAKELDEQFHFLTYTDQLYVEQLVKTGSQTEAMQFVLDKLSERLKGPAAEAVSWYTKLWRNLGKTFDEVQDKLHRQSEIVKIRDANPSLNMTYEQAEAVYEADQRQHSRAAGDEAAREQRNQQAKNNALFLHGESEKYRTAAQLREDYAKNIRARETADTAEQMNMTLAQLRAYDDSLIANYNDKHKDKKGTAPKIDHALKQEDQEIARANAAILEAKQQIALLNLGDEKSAEKVTAAQKEINRLLEMRKMSLQSRPGKVSDSQIDTEIEAWRKAQVAQEEEQRLRRQKTLEMTANKFSSETTTKWGISDAKTLDKYQQEAELIGQSATQRKLYAAALVIEEEQRAAILQLMEKTGAKTEQELTLQYPQQVAAINDAAQARREKMIPALEDEIALSQRWETGWSNAFSAFQDSAHNNATAAASVFNTMTSSMQSTLLNFFNTGKLGWKSFASAILVEIEKIMIAKAAAGLLGSAAGVVDSGAFDLLTSSAGPSTIGQANGGGWMNGVQFYANGDVFNSPTMFSHAGGLGVLGEAGPEAVMPLTRGSDGKLGVKASGGNGGGSVQIQQTFYIQQDGTTTQTGDAGQLSSVTQQMSDAMTNIAKATILQQMQPGGSIARVYGTKQ